MKRVISLFLILTMVFSMLSACSTEKDVEPYVNDVTESSTEAVEYIEATEVSTIPPSALDRMLADADVLRQSILNSSTEITVTGTSYYVANSGDDANDGLSPESAWATVDKVSKAKLKPGDGVFFKRGDVFREYILNCKKGVTYSAYGEGAKPIITASPENVADPEKWTQYANTLDGGTIWVYYQNVRDCGTLVLDGITGAHKVAPYWNGSSFVTKEGDAFDMTVGLKWNYSFFTPADSLLKLNMTSDRSFGGWKTGIPFFFPAYNESEGPLYFRCDEGNPGDVFDSIEFSERIIYKHDSERHAIVYMNSGSILDNIHVFAGPNCGIQHEDIIDTPFTVQNCEISFCGGSIGMYDDSGRAELAGDGLGISLPSRVINNYIHHNADDGITCEYGTGFKNYIASDVVVSGNLFEYNDLDFQITRFDQDMKANGCVFRDYLIEDNYFLNASNGWSNYLHTATSDSDFRPKVIINLGDFHLPLYTENVLFRNNVLYSDNVRAYISGANGSYEEKPYFENNTLYIKPHSIVDKENVGSILNWGIDFAEDTQPTVIFVATDEVVHPQPSAFDDWQDLLNDYLGSGNRLEFVD